MKLWTSFLFIIPALLAFYFHLFLYSVIIILAMVSSALYHLANEKNLYWLDVVMSALLMIFNLAYLLPLSFMSLPWKITAIIVLAAIFFWRKAHTKNYNVYHSMWHIASVLVTICCVLGYKLFSA